MMHRYGILLGIVALTLGVGPHTAAQQQWHSWSADYTVEYNAPATPADEIIDGPRPFTYTWNFGILNGSGTHTLGPSRIVVTPASGLGSLQPDVSFGVTYDATSNPPDRRFSVPALGLFGLHTGQFFGGLRSQAAAPVQWLGLDAVRSLSGGRAIAPGATEERTFTLTMTSRDATLNNMQAKINFRPFTPGPPPVSVPAFHCTASAGQAGPPLKAPSHTASGNVFWDVTSAVATEPLPLGATYTLTCTITVVNNNQFAEAEYMPAAHARADRNGEAVISYGESVELPSGAQDVPYPADPIGTVRFEVTPSAGEPRMARLRTRYARRASFAPVNAICKGSVRFTVAGVGTVNATNAGSLQLVVDGTETLQLPFGTTQMGGIDPGTYQLTATAASGLAVTPSTTHAMISCGQVTEVSFKLTDIQPPVISDVGLTPDHQRGHWQLWHTSPSVIDNTAPSPVCAISSVVPINPPVGGPDPAWVIEGPSSVRLSWAPHVPRTGRTYMIVTTCTDAAGNSATRAATLTIRHLFHPFW